MSNGCPYCQKQLSLINQRNIDVATNAYIDGDFESLSKVYDQRVSAYLVNNPIGYLITMLNDEIKIERHYKI